MRAQGILAAPLAANLVLIRYSFDTMFLVSSLLRIYNFNLWPNAILTRWIICFFKQYAQHHNSQLCGTVWNQGALLPMSRFLLLQRRKPAGRYTWLLPSLQAQLGNWYCQRRASHLLSLEENEHTQRIQIIHLLITKLLLAAWFLWLVFDLIIE